MSKVSRDSCWGVGQKQGSCRNEMRIKIISNGIVTQGTKVVNLETGELLEGVTAFTITAEVGGLVTAYLKVINVELDVVAEVTEEKPRGKELSNLIRRAEK